MPYYGYPTLVQKAVDSALRQDYRNVRVVVVGDGEVPPVRSRDPRLVVYTLDRNHGGPPFAQQLILLASPDPWYAPFCADDWLERSHISRLMAYRRSAVATGKVIWHREHEDGVKPRPHVRTVWYEVGLFRRERLLAFGGYGPNERVAQDNLVLGMLQRYGGLKVAKGVPTYHRTKHPNAIGSASETGPGSAVRNFEDKRNAELFEMAKTMTVEQIAEVRRQQIPAAVQAELDYHVDKLSALLWTH